MAGCTAKGPKIWAPEVSILYIELYKEHFWSLCVQDYHGGYVVHLQFQRSDLQKVPMEHKSVC